MNEMYDREHVDSVLRNVGMPKDRRNAILDEIHFPIDLDALQAMLGPLGITHDARVCTRSGH
jgi:hypothetical protein